MVKKHNISPEKSFLIGDRITDVQAGKSAGIKHLFLIANPRMLEMNENSSVVPLQSIFVSLKELKEFSLAMDRLNEN
jgi:histidinol phosphatase-like enzyme